MSGGERSVLFHLQLCGCRYCYTRVYTCFHGLYMKQDIMYNTFHEVSIGFSARHQDVLAPIIAQRGSTDVPDVQKVSFNGTTMIATYHPRCQLS